MTTDALKKRIDECDEAIRGNGKPGLNTRVAKLEQSMSTMAKIIWLLAGSIVTSVASIAVMAVTLLIK